MSRERLTGIAAFLVVFLSGTLFGLFLSNVRQHRFVRAVLISECIKERKRTIQGEVYTTRLRACLATVDQDVKKLVIP